LSLDVAASAESAGVCQAERVVAHVHRFGVREVQDNGELPTVAMKWSIMAPIPAICIPDPSLYEAKYVVY
jgi:hypothetical protein